MSFWDETDPDDDLFHDFDSVLDDIFDDEPGLYGAVGGRFANISLDQPKPERESPFLRKLEQVDDSEMCNLVDFLKEYDDHFKIPETDPKFAKISQDAEYIVNQMFSHLSPRFNAKIIPSGSFYENLKVESPDEFDFMVQITSLSSVGTLDLVPSDRSGFVHVTLINPEAMSLWQDCMAFVCEHKHRKKDCKICTDAEDVLSDINPFDQDLDDDLYEDHDFFDLYEDDDSSEESCNSVEGKGTIVLAPEKVQSAFRGEINKAVLKVKLPPGWKHGGYNSPNYSGHRRHGPATLFQFVYKDKNMEYKISLDVTLCIGLPLPFSAKKLNFHADDRTDRNNPLHRLLKDSLISGPGMHLIPLYSKLHTRTGYFGHKNSWRVSCSLVEREILNRFSPNDPDCVPRRIIRLMKLLRDTYLTDEKLPTKKSKKEKKTEQNKTANTSKGDTSDQKRKAPSDGRSRNQVRSPESPIANASGSTTQKWMENFYSIFSQPTDESVDTSSTVSTHGEDIKALEDDLEFFKDPGTIKYQYEDTEVDNMASSISSNEYYGAKNYVSSIEIKTFILCLVERHPYPEGWSESMIPDIIISVFQRIREMYTKQGYLQNFFFDIPVCSPLPASRRQTAMQKLDKMLHMMTEGGWKSVLSEKDVREMWKQHVI